MEMPQSVDILQKALVEELHACRKTFDAARRQRRRMLGPLPRGGGANTDWQRGLVADLSPRRNYILTRAVIAAQARGQAWTIPESRRLGEDLRILLSGQHRLEVFMEEWTVR